MTNLYETHKFNNITGDIFKFRYILNDNSFKKNKYLHKIFIKLTLPSIYSTKSRQFKWIKYLGYNIIKNVECKIKFINDKTINLYTYTEWLHIWNEINLSDEEKNIHYKLIGHTQELYDPANSNNRHNSYPSSHLNKETYRWIISDTNTKQANIVEINNDYNYNKPPSISSTTLYIPLNLYFCNNVKNILPLKYLKEFEVIVHFRPIEELYTVLLQPEDFVLDSNNQNISDSNFTNNIKLPSNINFVNNKIPNFSNSAHLNSNSNITDLSMFDVLINKYEIKPLRTGNTSINNFLIDPNSDPNNNNVTNIATNMNSITNFYNNYCNTNITFNFIEKNNNETNTNENNKIKVSGLLNPINFINVLNTNTNDDGSVKQATFNIAKNTANKVNETFFIIRHAERENKNDLLNFTNLDYNNTLEWDDSNKKNNTISYSSNIELLSNSIWEHESTNTSIKLGIDELGVFYIKKHILENNIFKYIDILNYKAEASTLNIASIYNSNSNKILNEKILDKFKLKIVDNNSIHNTITNEVESYDFYNKVCVYKKYKNTIPGLYYINNTYKGINKIELSSCDFNKITINSSDEYKAILFCNEEIIIHIN